jgi:hypothetical protein
VELVALIALVAALLAAVLAVPDARSTRLPQAIAAAILPLPGPAGPPTATPEPLPELVDRLMAGELDAFLAYRVSPDRDPRLDFSTDLCTAPVLGSSGPAYDFTQACLRHDFGYRNYGPMGTLDAQRRRVDERFLADMRASCLQRPGEQVIRCLGWARTYYRGVRAFGWIPARRYGEGR